MELTKNITESGQDTDHNAYPISYKTIDSIHHASAEHRWAGTYGIKYSQGQEKIKKRGWMCSSLFIGFG